MTDEPAILGYRKDRMGARLIGLLNVIRLGQALGVPARFAWIHDPHGPYPELADPHAFFAGDFVARHISVVPAVPDLAGRENLTALAANINHANLIRRIAGGARFFSEEAFAATVLMGEDPAEVRATLAAIADALPLTPRLERALRRARRKLQRRAGGLAGPATDEAVDDAPDGAARPPDARASDATPPPSGAAAAAARPVIGRGPGISAIHVRRGDILDGVPWSLSSWPSKFVPDEFFQAWASAQAGPVVAFTDTPDAVRHMARDLPHVALAADLLDLSSLTVAERDMLELLLMGGAERIGAPSGSAFSRAAQNIGRARLEVLPGDLPPDHRAGCHETLLQRCIASPHSFFALGDQAQSLQYAAAHAIATGQAGRLAQALAPRAALMQAHPFVRRILAECLMQAGDAAGAADAARAGLQDDRMQPRDQRLCQAVLDTLRAQEAPDAPETADAFLEALFADHSGENPLLARFAPDLILRESAVTRALLLEPALMARITAAQPAPDDETPPRLPAWICLIDWEDLLLDAHGRHPIHSWPQMHGKLMALGPIALEAAARSATEALPDMPASAQEAGLIGLAASVLSLHGRYRRALHLLHWLDRIAPDDALTQKRLADCCHRVGREDLSRSYLARALTLAPNSAALHFSAALSAAREGRTGAARRSLQTAVEQGATERFLKSQQRHVRQVLKRRAAAATDRAG